MVWQEQGENVKDMARRILCKILIRKNLVCTAFENIIKTNSSENKKFLNAR